jgi:outer membrane biosynthesis protein TonB
MKSKIEGKSAMMALILLGALALTSAASTTTNQATEPSKCSITGLQELPTKSMRSKLRQTQSIDPPCCGRNLNLKGTIVLLVVVGEFGDVSCVELVSGDPMIVNSAIRSVAKWRFKPYPASGQPRTFYGRLAIKFHATERTVTFKVIDQSPTTPSTPTTR